MDRHLPAMPSAVALTLRALVHLNQESGLPPASWRAMPQEKPADPPQQKQATDHGDQHDRPEEEGSRGAGSDVVRARQHDRDEGHPRCRTAHGPRVLPVDSSTRYALGGLLASAVPAGLAAMSRLGLRRRA